QRRLLAGALSLAGNHYWEEHRAVRVAVKNLERLSAEFRREVDQIVDLHTQGVVRERLEVRIEWHGLRRGIPLAGHIAWWHRPLLDRPHRLAIGAIEHVEQSLFGWLGNRFDASALDRDVGED